MITWRKNGREYRSTDGRFEMYCSGVVRNYYGSYASWVVVDTQTGRRTSASSKEKVTAAAERMFASEITYPTYYHGKKS